MDYLLCLIDGKKDYTKISDEQEKKISKLINEKKMPAKFKVNGKEILTETVLGFTNEVVSEHQKSKSWDELKKQVHESAWYKRAKGKSVSEPEPSVSPPNESLTFDGEPPRGTQHISRTPRLANR